MNLKEGQLPILLTNIIALVIFIFVFLSMANYEFIIYVGVIIALLVLLLKTNDRVNYPNVVLWGLTGWSLMHMAGGGLYFNDVRLYEIILIPIVGEPYWILKYDQFVHMIGFGVATMAMFYLIKPHLKETIVRWTGLSIVIVMSGLGIGALNEILEFIATVLVPETGVGGYHNTSLDLVANLIGAIIAMIFIYRQEKK